MGTQVRCALSTPANLPDHHTKKGTAQGDWQTGQHHYRNMLMLCIWFRRTTATLQDFAGSSNQQVVDHCAQTLLATQKVRCEHNTAAQHVSQCTHSTDTIHHTTVWLGTDSQLLN
jgi:hypothetical protein